MPKHGISSGDYRETIGKKELTGTLWIQLSRKFATFGGNIVIMDIIDFKDSLKHDIPPIGLTVQLEALWYDGKGEWERAHDLVDDLDDRESAHVHAYLHRKEGDLWNADYWYRRAKRQRYSGTLEEEWEELVKIM